MAPTKDAVELRLMSKASSLYYLQELNQREIADRLHLSRPKEIGRASCRERVCLYV